MLHQPGKKHQRVVSLQLRREDLIARSIFVWCDGGSHSDTVLNELELAEALAQFGPVSKCHVNKAAKKTYAIVEFADADAAERAIAQRKLIIGQHQRLTIKRRKFGNSDMAHQERQDATHAIDIEGSCLLGHTFHEQTVSFVEAHQQTVAEMDEKLIFCTTLETALRRFLPDIAQLRPFGSTVSGLGSRGCDLDCSLVWSLPDAGPRADRDCLFPRTTVYLNTAAWQNLEGDNRLAVRELESLQPSDLVYLLCKFIRELKQQDLIHVNDVQPQARGRYPLVNLRWKVNVEISVQNLCGLKNSAWLKTLASGCAPFRDFAFVVRHWAKVRGLCGTAGDSFSSYALTLIVITFCQTEKLVAAVQSLENDHNLFSVHTCLMIEPQLWPSEKQLLVGFFRFLAKIQSWKTQVVCPILGRVLDLNSFRALDNCLAPKAFRNAEANIQDPFDIAHNTAKNVTKQTVEKLRREAQNTSFLLAEKNMGLSCVISHSYATDAQSQSLSAPVLSGEHSRENHFNLDINHVDLRRNWQLESEWDWLTKARDACLITFTEILCFTIRELDACHTNSDRSESDPTSYAYAWELCAYARTWVGRRKVSRAFKRESCGAIPLGYVHQEREISLRIMDQHGSSTEPLVSFECRGYRMDSFKLRCDLTCCEIGAKEFNDLLVFLKSYIPKAVGKILGEYAESEHCASMNDSEKA